MTTSSLEAVSCLCGEKGAPAEVIVARDEYSGETFTYHRCRSCGLEFLNPRPCRSAISRYYPDTYSAYDADNARPEPVRDRLGKLIYHTYYAPAADRPLTVRLLRYPLMFLMAPLRGRPLFAFRPPALRRFFEFGSAVGRDMLLFRELGWEVFGCEPSAKACAIARAWGLEVQNCSAEEVALPPEHFSCILINNVFEHLHDPAGVLASCHQALIDGGVLVVVVPNHDSLPIRALKGSWPGYDAPRHLYGFSPRTLTHLLRKHGFTVEYIHHNAPMAWYWQSALMHWFVMHRRMLPLRGLSCILGWLAVPLGIIAARLGHGPFIKVVARKDEAS